MTLIVKLYSNIFPHCVAFCLLRNSDRVPEEYRETQQQLVQLEQGYSIGGLRSGSGPRRNQI